MSDVLPVVFGEYIAWGKKNVLNALNDLELVQRRSTKSWGRKKSRKLKKASIEYYGNYCTKKMENRLYVVVIFMNYNQIGLIWKENYLKSN